MSHSERLFTAVNTHPDPYDFLVSDTPFHTILGIDPEAVERLLNKGVDGLADLIRSTRRSWGPTPRSAL